MEMNNDTDNPQETHYRMITNFSVLTCKRHLNKRYRSNKNEDITTRITFLP